MLNTKYSTVSHTNPEEIKMSKLNIGIKGLVKYSHPKYGKSHVLVVRLGVCQLDKYPIEHYQFNKTADSKVPVNLKIPINEDFTKLPVYNFIQNILKTYGNKEKPELKYPVFDKLKESNYIKIKFMDSYNSYTVTEIITDGDFKIKTKIHKPTSIADLYGLFSSNTQIVPYVMLYFHKTSAGDFVTLRPVKFYIGKSLSLEQIDYISKKSKYIETPKSDFYNANQMAKHVSLSDFMEFINNTDMADSNIDINL